MAKRKANNDLERRREQKKLSMRKAREKIKTNPELYEAAKEKERQRWHKRKEEGKILNISNLSERDKRKKRKTWRKWTKTCSDKRKNLKEMNNFASKNTPPGSPNENVNPQPISSTSRLQSGKKIARRNRDHARKQIKGYEEKCKQLKRRLNRYKKRLQRLKQKEERRKIPIDNTPRKTVNKLLKESDKNRLVIRKKLLFGEVIKRQVTENMKKVKSKKIKKQIVSIVSGQLISKYKLMTDVRSMTLSKIKRFQGYHGKKIIYLEIGKARTAVTDFLEKDKNSRLCPGKKDTITRHKIKKQKRFLNETMKNLHKDFVKTNPKYKGMSYSTFCRLRPFWIVKPVVTDRDTCLCKVHENMSLIVNKLKVLKLISENSPKDILKNICCSDDLPERCLERTCILCKNKRVIFNTEPHDLNENITYFQWAVKRVPVVLKSGEKIVQKTIKEEVNCTKSDLIKALENSLNKYMSHIANIQHQYTVLDAIKKSLPVDHGFLHMDFSENYACKYASEIQSAYFGGSKAQITIHTSVFYYRDLKSNEIKPIPFATMSENCRHDPVAVTAHLLPVFREIKKLIPSLKCIHFLSDGPSTQYKNKLLFQLFGTFMAAKLLPKSMMWHYTESGHGKGAPDGVGGLLKRTADAVVARGVDITNVATLVDNLKENCKGICILPFDENDLEEVNQATPNNLIPFKGTTNIHQLTWNSKSSHMFARRLTCISCETDQECPHYGLGKIKLLTHTSETSFEPTGNKNHKSKSLSYSDVYTSSDDSEQEEENGVVAVNDYVVVKLAAKKRMKYFVALIVSCEELDLTVKYMKKISSNKFVFDGEELWTVPKNDIVGKLNQPTVNNREQYIFSDLNKFDSFDIN